MKEAVQKLRDRFVAMPEPTRVFVSLLVGGLVVVLATILFSILNWWSASGSRVASLEPRVAQILGFLEADLDVRTALQERNDLLSAMALPSSGDSGRGGALLQERVRSLSSQVGLTVIGTEVREPTELEGLVRLSVNAKLVGAPDAVVNFFQSLNEQRPFLFVSSFSLSTERNVARTSAGRSRGSEGDLFVDIEIYAYQETGQP